MPQINLSIEEHQSLTRLLSATLKNKSKFDDNSTSIFKDTLDVITNDKSTFMSMTDICDYEMMTVECFLSDLELA